MEKGSKGKCGKSIGGGGGVASGAGKAPYSAAARKEKSKFMAQQRRNTYKSIMDDLTQVKRGWGSKKSPLIVVWTPEMRPPPLIRTL